MVKSDDGKKRAEQQERGSEPAAASGSGDSAGAAELETLPKIDFSTLIVSLSTSALYSLGLAPDPETGKREAPNFPMARQTIDTLELLEEKTRGNLDEEEHKLLDSLLYELRLRFVEVHK